jgi:D-sedoheptulose 7-phosphate isomerase
MKQNSVNILKNLFTKYPVLSTCRDDIFAACELLKKCFSSDGKLLLCGNGGSAADCEHIAGELLKSFKVPRPLTETQKHALSDFDSNSYIANNLQRGLPAIPLTGFMSFNTAFSNDVSPDLVYAQITHVLGRKGDVLIGISTSGNSINVLNALKAAKANGLYCIGLTGESGGQMKELCDICICVPASETYAVQEYHLPVYHAVCAAIEEEFFGNQ